MVQDAIITKLLPDNMAEVTVVRATACGKNCSSCESCIFQNELKVSAVNLVHAKPGSKVLIESKTSTVFGAILAVYLLPLITMLIGYFLAFNSALSESMCVVGSFAGFVAGMAITVIVHRKIKKSNSIEFIIIKELS